MGPFFKSLTLLAFIFFAAACVKDTIVKKQEAPQTATASKNDVVVTFNAMLNGKALVPKSKWYSNASAEAFTVTKLNYYISNIKLTDDNGNTFAEKESYHLIKHVDSLNSFIIKDVPIGNYNKIQFIIGVDSTRNVSGAQTGALDPANVMFWEWKSGYIFFKLEGSYASASTNEMEYAVHVGGFTGKYSCLQSFNGALSSPLIVQGNKVSKMYFNTRVDEMFKTPDVWSFDKYYQFISDSMFQVVSKHYKNMFVFDHIEN